MRKDRCQVDPRLIDGVGLWFERLSGARSNGGPMLLLDRDGVVVEEVGYLRRAEDVRMVTSAASAIRAANALNVRVALVTNQSGIGRGLYSWHDFDLVQGRIISQLALAGAHIDVVLACAYHSSAIGELACEDHPWRKPNSGMVKAAADSLGADLARSMIVGDRLSDLRAGRGAGVGHGLVVKTGYGGAEAARLSPECFKPMSVEFADDISAIEGWLTVVSRL